MRAALIGAGQIARQHLACLEGLPGVEIAAVCDLSPAAAECAAQRHGATAWFTDYATMLREVRPDVVHMTTPPTSHYKLSVDALEAGAHVIVEKPITTTLRSSTLWCASPPPSGARSLRTITISSIVGLARFCVASSLASSGRSSTLR